MGNWFVKCLESDSCSCCCSKRKCSSCGKQDRVFYCNDCFNNEPYEWTHKIKFL